MAEKTTCIVQQQTKPIKVLKWKVSEGSTVSAGRVLLLYDFEGANKHEQRKLKLASAGTIRAIFQPEGAIVAPGATLCELEACCHPTIMNEMCADCGADLRKNEAATTASVPMVHAIPDLKVSEELAQKLGKADNERLIKDRKLVLLVDLDQTLIHTTNDNIPPNIKDVYHFQLYGPSSPWYHTRLRPGTHEFLSNICPFFELHICTFGARNYAHTIAAFLDKDQHFFSNRILSRDECFDPTSKKANLKALFPCGDNMVCIIDDREDVWSHAANLIHVKPYHFFQHTGDINAPPGLDKQENDEKEGVDLSKFTETIPNEEEEEEVEDVEKPSDKLENKAENEKCEEKVKTKANGSKCTLRVNSDEHVEEKKPELEEMNEASVANPQNNKPLDSETPNENNIQKTNVKRKDDDDKSIEIEDPDDYLLYLEDILRRIHMSFYELYDKMESGEVPDLKKVIPCVRSEILKGCKLVFSGLVPTHIKLEQSKAYQIARNLGAEVTQDLEEDTTHLVAVRPGTAKVNAGRRKKNLKIVTPDWLWCCAERWKHADEKIFPLSNKGSKNRHPPPHCSSPEHITNYPEHNTPAIRKRTPSGRFMDTINPLMSFSSADIADMDKEVEDILDDDSESSGDENAVKNTDDLDNKNSSSSSCEELEEEYPRGFKRQRLQGDEDGTDLGKAMNDDEDETISEKFRRGENVNDVLDVDKSDSDDESEGSLEAPDEVDDGEWNMMGAALEREFLSNN